MDICIIMGRKQQIAAQVIRIYLTFRIVRLTVFGPVFLSLNVPSYIELYKYSAFICINGRYLALLVLFKT